MCSCQRREVGILLYAFFQGHIPIYTQQSVPPSPPASHKPHARMMDSSISPNRLRSKEEARTRSESRTSDIQELASQKSHPCPEVSSLHSSYKDETLSPKSKYTSGPALQFNDRPVYLHVWEGYSSSRCWLPTNSWSKAGNWAMGRLVSTNKLSKGESSYRTKNSLERKTLRGKLLPVVYAWTFLTCLLCQSALACNDVRSDLSDYPCLEYDPASITFHMVCSFSWTDNTKCIVLLKNEKFEGNSYSIDLNGTSNWEGLFRIAQSNNGGPSSLADAALIEDVHMIGGETSRTGGFIVQSQQNHFIVKNCSSSGVIRGHNCCYGGGGICGQRCSGDILITHCWSSGEIRGYSTGGIAGRELGRNGGKDSTVNISHCYSTGEITGRHSGGICATRAGRRNNGMITIEQCYSVGEIRGPISGGIAGSRTAESSSHFSISNCYSRGDITGAHTGGIVSTWLGDSGGTVILTNVYASGKIMHPDAAGII